LSNLVNITYGTGAEEYDFGARGPVPFLTINTIYNKSAGGDRLGTLNAITVEGTLTPLPTGVGYQTLDSMQDALVEAFSTDGKKFNVTCDGSDLIVAYPRISSLLLDRSSNNWVQTTPYTIDLEWDGSGITDGTYLSDASETWNISIRPDSSKYDWSYTGVVDTNSTVLEVSHELSANGLSHYESEALISPAWQQARGWVVSQLGRDTSVIDSSGVLNLTSASFTGLNHIRVENRNVLGGAFGVTETWTEINDSLVGGIGSSIEDFTAGIRFDRTTGLTTVDVAGSIQGLETVSYGANPGDFSVDVTKWEAASGSWDIIRPKLLSRASIARDIASTETYNRAINPAPTNLSIGHNPRNGVINYNYSYDDRICNFISNVTSENISVTDVYPVDVFASLTVLGRAHGPILQPIDTVTSSKRNVNIDVVVQPTGCTPSLFFAGRPKADVELFLCAMQTDISGAGVQMFKSSDQDNWNPRSGRYTRSVEWTYTSCTGDPPNTNFC
jgi:hypothetical protein